MVILEGSTEMTLENIMIKIYNKEQAISNRRFVKDMIDAIKDLRDRKTFKTNLLKALDKSKN